MEHTGTDTVRKQQAFADSKDAPVTTTTTLESLFNLLRGKGHEYEHYGSSFEKTVRDTLIEEQLTFLYEPIKFRIPSLDLPRSWEYTYTPDFLLKVKVDGKLVLIEAKGRKYFDSNIFTKYPLFMQQYGDRFYFIIITDLQPEKILEGMNTYGKNSKIADEIWNVSHIHQGDNWKAHEEEEKAFIRARLAELMVKSGMRMLRMEQSSRHVQK